MKSFEVGTKKNIEIRNGQRKKPSCKFFMMDLGFQEVSSVFNTNTFSKQAWLKLQIWL